MNYLRNSYRQSLKSNLQLAYFLWVATREVIAQTILLKFWVLCLEEGPDCVTVQWLQVGLKREQLWLSLLPTFIWPATTCKCSVSYPLLKEGPHPVTIHKQELKWSLVTLSAHYSKQCLLSCERQPVNHAVTTVSWGLQNQKQRIPALNNYKTAPPPPPPPPSDSKHCQRLADPKWSHAYPDSLFFFLPACEWQNFMARRKISWRQDTSSWQIQTREKIKFQNLQNCNKI